MPLVTGLILKPYRHTGKYCLTFTQGGVDGRRDQRDKRFQVKAAGSGLGFQQPVSLLQVYNIRLLHCSEANRGIHQREPFQVSVLFSGTRNKSNHFSVQGCIIITTCRFDCKPVTLSCMTCPVLSPHFPSVIPLSPPNKHINLYLK